MSQHSGNEGAHADAARDCPHARLMPRWRGPEAMGDDSRALGFVCQDCGREFPTYRVRDRKLIAP